MLYFTNGNDNNQPAHPYQRAPLWLQLGANANQGIFVGIGGVSTQILGRIAGIEGGDLASISVLYASGVDISPKLSYMDSALSYVSGERAKLGAVQNRLEHTARSLAISSENLQDSESRIRNSDMAREMMRFVQASVLQQSGIAMLAQANRMPYLVLQLLR